MKNKDRNKAGISTISTTPTFLTDNTDCIDHNLGFIHALHRARWRWNFLNLISPITFWPCRVSWSATTLPFPVDFNHMFYFGEVYLTWRGTLNLSCEQYGKQSRHLCSLASLSSRQMNWIWSQKLKHREQEDIWALSAGAEMWRARKSQNKVNCGAKYVLSHLPLTKRRIIAALSLSQRSQRDAMPAWYYFANHPSSFPPPQD